MSQSIERTSGTSGSRNPSKMMPGYMMPTKSTMQRSRQVNTAVAKIDARTKQHSSPIDKAVETTDAPTKPLHETAFFRLPGEIRNRIYMLTFDQEAVRLTCKKPTRIGGQLVRPQTRQHPLNRVCAGLRRETLPLFYSHHRFEIRCQCHMGDGHHAKVASAGLRWLGAICQHVHFLYSVDLWVTVGKDWQKHNVGFRLRRDRESGKVRVFVVCHCKERSRQKLIRLLKSSEDAAEAPGAVLAGMATILLEDKRVAAVLELDVDWCSCALFLLIYGPPVPAK